MCVHKLYCYIAIRCTTDFTRSCCSITYEMIRGIIAKEPRTPPALVAEAAPRGGELGCTAI